MTKFQTTRVGEVTLLKFLHPDEIPAAIMELYDEVSPGWYMRKGGYSFGEIWNVALNGEVYDPAIPADTMHVHRPGGVWYYKDGRGFGRYMPWEEVWDRFIRVVLDATQELLPNDCVVPTSENAKWKTGIVASVGDGLALVVTTEGSRHHPVQSLKLVYRQEEK